MNNECHVGRFAACASWPGPRRQARWVGIRLWRSRGSRRSFLRSEGYYQPQAAQDAAPEMEL